MILIRKFLKPAVLTYHRIRGYPFEDIVNFLGRSQWWDREQIDEYQNEKLRSLIQHAYNNVPYYRSIMDKYGLKPAHIQCEQDLTKMPILTKRDVRNHYADLIARDTNSHRTLEYATGGSTGIPVRILMDYNNMAWSSACIMRCMSWGGYRFGLDTRAQLSCGSLGLKSKTLFDKLKAYVMGYVAIPAEDGLSDLKVEDYRKRILKSGATYLAGYPSLIYLLGRFFEAANVDDIKFKAIFSTSEPLFDFQREYMQNFFECPVFDYYGSREIMGVACECEKHNGHHIHEEHVVLESVQGEDSRVVFYEPGRFLITNLDSYAMPLIRYENGDAGIISKDDRCSCGRAHKLISKLYGRVQDFLVTEDGKLISGIFFRTLVRRTKTRGIGIDEYQVVQESRNLIRLLVVKNVNFSDEDMQSMVETIKRYFGSGMRVGVEFVDEIPKTKSGKQRVTICKISDQYGINEQINSASLFEI